MHTVWLAQACLCTGQLAGVTEWAVVHGMAGILGSKVSSPPDKLWAWSAITMCARKAEGVAAVGTLCWQRTQGTFQACRTCLSHRPYSPGADLPRALQGRRRCRC